MIKFKNILLIVLFSVLVPISLFCQFSLRIEIMGLRNSYGQVLLEISNEKGEKIAGYNQLIENKKCIIVLQNFKLGNYSFKYFHDENRNWILDANIIGIPKEGFGFSNNAKGTFGPPSLKETIFSVKGNQTFKCVPVYY